ncbi:MAG: G8 domain-containing protein [Vicinamibacterales bacterium]
MLHALHTRTSHTRPARPFAQSPIPAFVTVVALGALMLLGSPRTASAATCDQFNCTTMHDIVPNFAAQPTIRSTQSGAWSNSATWNLGRVPTAADIVAITGGTTVTVDGTSAVAGVIGVEATGLLRFRPDVNTKLTVGTLQLFPQGGLEVGTQASPVLPTVLAELVVANKALDLTNDGVGTFDPRQFGTGVLGIDARITMFGAVRTAFVRLATEPKPGDLSLTLESPVSGWRAGDRLVLPDSKHVPSATASSYVFEGENPVVSSVSSDGLTVYLASAILYAHPGARDGNDVLEFLPHVGNLTRNIVVRSENPLGTRGHVLMTERTEVSIQHASFRNLGRATVDPIDSTTFDSQGNVVHMGTNHIGRYPLHMHHVLGSTTPSASGYQFILQGNVVDDDASINRRKWAMVVHASHYGLIKHNVVHNAGGWGIGTEDGSESFNEFTANFIVKVRGEGTREQAEGGNGMWFRGPNNRVTDNVIANVRGNMVEGSHGIQYYHVYLGNICVPNFPGADPHTQCTNRNGNALPLLEFARNEVYGAMEIGLGFWWVGSDAYVPFTNPGSTIKDFRTWHFTLYGTYGYPASKITFDGYVARGRKGVLSNSNEFLRGIWFSDYMMHDTVIRNADIQNMRDGIMAPYFTKGSTLIENSYLRNSNNIVVVTIGAPGSYPYGPNMPPKQTIINNVKFAQVNGSVGPGVSQYNIYMNYWLQFGSANLIKRDAVFVYNYDQVAGDDFQVFYNEQTPGFIVPKSSGNLAGSPVAGLTNAQNWTTYGIAIAGEVATSTTTRPYIYGLVRNGAAQMLPSPPTVTTVTQTASSLSIAFVPGAPGQSPVTNYEYTVDGGASWTPRSPASTSTPIVVAGLTPGTTYAVQLRAVNANGQSAASNQVLVSTTALAAMAVSITPTSLSSTVGKMVTFSASVSGGTGPYTYQFYVYDGKAWTVGQSWSASSTWTWCPPKGGAYKVQVWVRNAGSSSSTYDAWAGAAVSIARPTVATISCVVPSASSGTAGTPVTWTVQADGGKAPYTYKFLVFDGARWTVERDWSTSATWTWTPTRAGNYGVQVWLRNYGSKTTRDAYRDVPSFLVDRPAQAELTALTPSLASPVPAGTPITWTAVSAGGTRPHKYAFAVHDGTSWRMLSDMMPSDSMNWLPTAPGTYTMKAWLKDGASTSSFDDVMTSAPFTVSAPAAISTTMSLDRSGTIPAKTPVVVSMVTRGGTGPYLYQYYVHDGVRWSVGQAWTTNSTWTWVPPVAKKYQIQVWVKNAGSTKNYDTYKTISGITVGTQTALATPTLTMSPRSVMPAGEPTVFTARTSGGTGPYTYQFVVSNGVTTTVMQPWSASDTFAWLPSLAGTYSVQVQVRSAGSTAAYDKMQVLTPIVITP